MVRPRVLLADDHRMLREAFTRVLEPECDVVGGVSDGQAMLDAVRELSPDVVVLDVAMPLMNGLEAARRLGRMAPKVRIVFLTMSEDPEVAAEAFRAGAAGFVLKNSAAAELTQAVREVVQGRSYITALATRGVVDSLLQTRPARRSTAELSGRQREVLELLAEGRTMKEIARALKITPRTVAFHKYAMMEELGIRSSAELIRYAMKEHIVA
jgi:DNA-binding NarL/FixJ family response regulator